MNKGAFCFRLSKVNIFAKIIVQFGSLDANRKANLQKSNAVDISVLAISSCLLFYIFTTWPVALCIQSKFSETFWWFSKEFSPPGNTKCINIFPESVCSPQWKFSWNSSLQLVLHVCLQQRCWISVSQTAHSLFFNLAATAVLVGTLWIKLFI